MKTKLLFLLALLGLSGQPLQAAHYAKKALAAISLSAFYGLVWGSTKKIDATVEQNPERYLADNLDLIKLIKHEAQKRNIDPSTIIVTKNLRQGINTIACHETICSLFTKRKFMLDIGIEPNTPLDKSKLSDYERIVYVPHFDKAWITPVIQHELNHINHHDHAKRAAVASASSFGAYCLLDKVILSRIPFAKIPYSKLRMLTIGTCYALSLPASFLTAHYTCILPLARYQEKQADLAIDDDPEIIKGAIDWLQSNHDIQVALIGKEAMDNFHKNTTHPHPLERVAYLTEKLNNVLEKQEQENK